jgi:hypothetical protein
MCSICKETLPDFNIPHEELRCPLRNSYYCSNCAKYGHLTKKCPDRPSIMFREVTYLEQLISPNDLKQFGITSVTPLCPKGHKVSSQSQTSVTSVTPLCPKGHKVSSQSQTSVTSVTPLCPKGHKVSSQSQTSVTSVTPLCPKGHTEEEKQILEIKNDDKVISVYLSARGIKTTKRDRKLMLEQYATLNNKRVVYV